MFQEALLEAEERYRRAMVSNAQLHNNKFTLMYQVETLKDELSDLEELLWETRRHRDELDKVRWARSGWPLQEYLTWPSVCFRSVNASGRSSVSSSCS